MSINRDHVSEHLNQNRAHVNEDEPQIQGPFLHKRRCKLELLHETGIEMCELQTNEVTYCVDVIVVVVHLILREDFALCMNVWVSISIIIEI